MKYLELKSVLDETKKKMAECFKDYLKEGFGAIFEKYPKLKSLRWEQYAPYFNDGDACIFHVWHYFEDDDILFEDGFEDTNGDDYGYGDAYKDVADMASDIIGGADEDDFEQLFGDGVRVTVTRDGFEVENYDHD